jgi:hypothetical protein
VGSKLPRSLNRRQVKACVIDAKAFGATEPLCLTGR